MNALLLAFAGGFVAGIVATGVVLLVLLPVVVGRTDDEQRRARWPEDSR